MTSIVLASGGMDSCVTTAIAASESEPALLHVSYGQRTADRELRAFHAVAEHYKVGRRLVTNIDHLRQIGGSSLTDRSIEVSAANIDAPTIPTSYVPFRNAHLLAIATSWAEVVGPTESTLERSPRIVPAIPTAALNSTRPSAGPSLPARVRRRGSR